MPRAALVALLFASLYLLLRGAGVVRDGGFVVWVQAALFAIFIIGMAISVKAGNALWSAIFAALAVGWNPWVPVASWHHPLPWDKWAAAMSLACGVAAGVFVVRYWGRGASTSQA